MARLDHIAMERNSEASRAARYSLNIHDEKTGYFSAFPSHARDAEAVLDAVHRFDDDEPAIRRWWTDAAPEFAAAARTIRSTRPLAYYNSTLPRLQAIGRAERVNRLMIEGTRCLLMS